MGFPVPVADAPTVDSTVPVVGFAAFSGTGKTTLLTKLLPLLKRKGLRVGVVKHTHHRFEIDRPGKDSYELRRAGADQMLIAGRYRWALMSDTPAEQEPSLNSLLKRMDRANLDLVLVEGFRHEAMPKIELYRPALGKPLLFPHDPWIVALATDDGSVGSDHIPLLDINDSQAIADFILSLLQRR